MVDRYVEGWRHMARRAHAEHEEVTQSKDAAAASSREEKAERIQCLKDLNLRQGQEIAVRTESGTVRGIVDSFDEETARIWVRHNLLVAKGMQTNHPMLYSPLDVVPEKRMEK